MVSAHRQPLAELPLPLFLPSSSTHAKQPHKRPLDCSPDRHRGTPPKRRMLDFGRPEPPAARKLFLDSLTAHHPHVPGTPPHLSPAPTRLMPSPPIASRVTPRSAPLMTPNNPPSLHTPSTPRPHHIIVPSPGPEDDNKENRPPRRRSGPETPRAVLADRHVASLMETAMKGKERQTTPREREEAKREMLREVDEPDEEDEEEEEDL